MPRLLKTEAKAYCESEEPEMMSESSTNGTISVSSDVTVSEGSSELSASDNIRKEKDLEADHDFSEKVESSNTLSEIKPELYFSVADDSSNDLSEEYSSNLQSDSTTISSVEDEDQKVILTSYEESYTCKSAAKNGRIQRKISSDPRKGRKRVVDYTKDFVEDEYRELELGEILRSEYSKYTRLTEKKQKNLRGATRLMKKAIKIGKLLVEGHSQEKSHVEKVLLQLQRMDNVNISRDILVFAFPAVDVIRDVSNYSFNKKIRNAAKKMYHKYKDYFPVESKENFESVFTETVEVFLEQEPELALYEDEEEDSNAASGAEDGESDLDSKSGSGGSKDNSSEPETCIEYDINED